MGHIEPTEEQIQALAGYSTDEPLVMVNLLKFKEGEGQALHQRYLTATLPLVQERGGRLLYRGQGQLTVIGEAHWDEVVIIEYPNKQALLNVLQAPAYEAVAHYRNEAVEDSCTLLTTALST